MAERSKVRTVFGCSKTGIVGPRFSVLCCPVSM
jgi:hypothetical protein